MASLNTTTFSYALKRLYPRRKIENLVYEGAGPTWAMLPKDEKFTGTASHEAVIYGDTSGRSSTFSIAQENKAGSRGVAFLLTRVANYSLASIDSETILASQGNEGALITAVKNEMDSAFNSLSRSLGRQLFGDGSGSIGTISATTVTSTTTLGFANADDIVNVEVGDSLVFAAGITSALRSATSLSVVSVNRSAGTVVLSATPDSLSASIAVGDTIFIEGDYDSASDRNALSGLAAWVPATAPTSTAFFGVDRSVDVTRLGGHRLVGTALPVDEALKKLASDIAREGGKPDIAILNFRQFDALTSLLGSKVQYVDHKVGEVGFQGVLIHGPKGPIKVFPDHNCPGNVGYVLTKDSWKIKSLGPCPRILDLDGSKMLRESTADAYEIRIASFAQVCCVAPGWNGRVSLTAVS